MLPRFLPLVLVAACASKGGQGARGQGEVEVVVPPPPTGGAWRTARKAPWKEMLEDLAEADVVFVGGDRGTDLAVLEYLFNRGRLHAIGLETFPRTAQKALDDFSFGRIDEAGLEKRCGAIADADRPVLAFARQKKLPVLGLGVEAEIRAAFAGDKVTLTEEQLMSLPALPTTGPGDTIPVPDLEREVATDVVARWYRGAAPEGAQVAILAERDRIAPRDGLPERLFARSGKTYRTLVSLPGPADKADGAVFAKSYADYVWFTGDK